MSSPLPPSSPLGGGVEVSKWPSHLVPIMAMAPRQHNSAANVNTPSANNNNIASNASSSSASHLATLSPHVLQRMSCPPLYVLDLKQFVQYSVLMIYPAPLPKIMPNPALSNNGPSAPLHNNTINHNAPPNSSDGAGGNEVAVGNESFPANGSSAASLGAVAISSTGTTLESLPPVMADIPNPTLPVRRGSVTEGGTAPQLLVTNPSGSGYSTANSTINNNAGTTTKAQPRSSHHAGSGAPSPTVVKYRLASEPVAAITLQGASLRMSDASKGFMSHYTAAEPTPAEGAIAAAPATATSSGNAVNGIDATVHPQQPKAPNVAELRIPNHPAAYLLHLPPPQLLAPSVGGVGNSAYSEDEVGAFWRHMGDLSHFITVANRVVNARPCQPLLLRMRMDFANSVGAVVGGSGQTTGGGGGGVGGGLTPEVLAKELQAIRASFAATAGGSTPMQQSSHRPSTISLTSPHTNSSTAKDPAVLDALRKAERDVRRRFAAERRRLNRLNCQGLNALTVSLSTHTRKSRRRPAARAASLPAGMGGGGGRVVFGSNATTISPSRRASSRANPAMAAAAVSSNGKGRSFSTPAGKGLPLSRKGGALVTIGGRRSSNIDGNPLGGGGEVDTDPFSVEVGYGDEDDEEDVLSMDEMQSSSDDEEGASNSNSANITPMASSASESKAKEKTSGRSRGTSFSARGGSGSIFGAFDMNTTPTTSPLFASLVPPAAVASPRREKRLAARRAVRDRERMLLESGEASDLNRGTVAVTAPFTQGQKKTSCSVAMAFTVGSATQLNFNVEMEHAALGRLITFRKFRPLLAAPDAFLPNASASARRMSVAPMTPMSPLPKRSVPAGPQPPIPTSPVQRGSSAARQQQRSLSMDRSSSPNPSPSSPASHHSHSAMMRDEARFLYEDVAKEEWWARLAPFNTITIAELLARHKSRQTAAVIELVSASNAPMCLQMAESYRFGPHHKLPDVPPIKGRVEVWVEPLPSAFELFHFSAVGLVRRAGQVGVVTYADPILRLQVKPHPLSPYVTHPRGLGAGGNGLGATNDDASVSAVNMNGSAGAAPAVPSAVPSMTNPVNASLYLSEGYRNAHAAVFLPIPVAHAPSAILDEREPLIDLSSAAATLIDRLTAIVPSNVSTTISTGPNAVMARGGDEGQHSARRGGAGSTSNGGAASNSNGAITRHVMCSAVLPGDVLPPVPVLKMGAGPSNDAQQQQQGADGPPGKGTPGGARGNSPPRAVGAFAPRRPMSPQSGGSPSSVLSRRTQSAPSHNGAANSGSGGDRRPLRTLPRSSLLAQTVLVTQGDQPSSYAVMRSQSMPNISRRLASSAPFAPALAMPPIPLPPTAAIPILTCAVPMRDSTFGVHVIDGIRGCAVGYAAAVAEASGGNSASTAMNGAAQSPAPVGGTGASSAGAAKAKGGASSASASASAASFVAAGAGTQGPQMGGLRVAPVPSAFVEDGSICPILLGSLDVRVADLATRSKLAVERGPVGLLSGHSPSATPTSGALVPLSPSRNALDGIVMSPARSEGEGGAASTRAAVASTTVVGVLSSQLKRHYTFEGQTISDYDQTRQAKEVYPEVGADCYADYPPPQQRKSLASKALLTSYIAEGRVLSSRLGLNSTISSGGSGGAAAAGGTPQHTGVLISDVDNGSVEARRQAAMAAASSQKQGAIPVPMGGIGGSSAVGTSAAGTSPRRTGARSPTPGGAGRGRGFARFSRLTGRGGRSSSPRNNPNAVEGPYGALLANNSSISAASGGGGTAAAGASDGLDQKPCQNTIVPNSYRVPPSVTVMHLQHQRIVRGIPTPCSRHNFGLLEFLRSPKNGIEFHAITAIDYGTRTFVNRRIRRHLDLSCFPTISNTRDLEDIVDPLPYVEYGVSFCRVTKRALLLHGDGQPNGAVGPGDGDAASPPSSSFSPFPNGWSAMSGILAVVQQMLEPIAFRNAKSHAEKATVRPAHGTSDTHNLSPFGAARVLHRWREGKRVSAPCPPMPAGDVVVFYNETRLSQECEDEGDEMADVDGEGFNDGGNDRAYAGLNNAEYGGGIVRRLYVAKNEGTTRPIIFPLSVEKDLNMLVMAPNADMVAGGYDVTNARGALLYQALSGKYGTGTGTGGGGGGGASSIAIPPPQGRFVHAPIPDTDLIDQHQLPTALDAFNKKWFASAKGSYEARALTDIAAARASMYGVGKGWLRKGSSKANAVEAVMAEKERALLTSEEEILEAYCLRPRDSFDPEALTAAVGGSGSGGANADHRDGGGDRRSSLSGFFAQKRHSVGGGSAYSNSNVSGGLDSMGRRRGHEGGAYDDDDGDGSQQGSALPVGVVYDEDYSYPHRYRLALPAARAQIIKEDEQSFLASLGMGLSGAGGGNKSVDTSLVEEDGGVGGYHSISGASNSSRGTTPSQRHLGDGQEGSAAAPKAPAHVYNMFNHSLGITSPLQLRLTETAETLVGDLKDEFSTSDPQRAHYRRQQYRRALLQQPPSPILDVLKAIVERCRAKQAAREALFAKEVAARAAVDEENDEDEWSDDEQISVEEASSGQLFGARGGNGGSAQGGPRDPMASSVAANPASFSPSVAALLAGTSSSNTASPSSTILHLNAANPHNIHVDAPPTITQSYFDRVPRTELIMNPREQRRAFQHEGRAGRDPRNRSAKSHLQQDSKCPTIHHVASVVVCHPLQRSSSSIPPSQQQQRASAAATADGAAAITGNERSSCDLASIMQYLTAVSYLPIHFVFIFVNCEAPAELTRLPNVLTTDFYTLAAEMMREVPAADRLGQFFETLVVKPTPPPPAAATAKGTADASANLQHRPSSAVPPALLDGADAAAEATTRPPSGASTSSRAGPNGGGATPAQRSVTFKVGDNGASTPAVPLSPLSSAALVQSSSSVNEYGSPLSSASRQPPVPLTAEAVAARERQRSTLLTVHASMRSLHRTYDDVSSSAVNYCRARYTDDQLPYDALDTCYDPNELVEAAEMTFDELSEAARQKDLEAQMAAVAEAVAETARRARGGGGGADDYGGYGDPFASSGAAASRRVSHSPSGGLGGDGLLGTSATFGADSAASGELDGSGDRRPSAQGGGSVSPRGSIGMGGPRPDGDRDEAEGGAGMDGGMGEVAAPSAAFDEALLPVDERQNIPTYTAGESCFAQIDTWRYANGDPTANRVEHLKARERYTEVFAPGDGSATMGVRARTPPRGDQYGPNAVYNADGGFNVVIPPSAVMPPSVRPGNTQGTGPEQHRRLMVLQSLSPSAVQQRARSPALVAGRHVQGEALMSRHLSDDDEEDVVWSSESALAVSAHQGGGGESPFRSTSAAGGGGGAGGRRVGVEKAALTVLDVFMEPEELQKHEMHAAHIANILNGGEDPSKPAKGGAAGARSNRANGKMRLVRSIAHAHAGSSSRRVHRASSPARATSPLAGGGGRASGKRDLSPKSHANLQQHMKELMLLEERVLRRKLQQLQQRDDVWVALDDVTPQEHDGSDVQQQQQYRGEGDHHGPTSQHRSVVTVRIDPKFRDLNLNDDDDDALLEVGGAGAGSGLSPAHGNNASPSSRSGALRRTSGSNSAVANGSVTNPQRMHSKSLRSPVEAPANGGADASGGDASPDGGKGGTLAVIGGKHSHAGRFTVYRVHVDGAPLSQSLFTTNNALAQATASSTANRFLQLSRAGTLASNAKGNGMDPLKSPSRPSTAAAFGGTGPSPRKSATISRTVDGSALLGTSSGGLGGGINRPRNVSPSTARAGGNRTRSASPRGKGRAGSARGDKKHTVDEMLYTDDGSVSLQGLAPAKARQLRAMLRSENAVYGGPKVDVRQVRSQEEQWEQLYSARVQSRHQREEQRCQALVQSALGGASVSGGAGPMSPPQPPQNASVGNRPSTSQMFPSLQR